eukprot:Pompholyxophrys_punicea_v1_NODE_898_length_1162_cov_5.476965.p2 type:complete len:109 gc:universal NODE_898_length_1162_cov_5.476965:330-656(+)
MKKFENVLLLLLWNDVLTQLNNASKIIQRSDSTLETATTLMFSLKNFLLELRERYEFYESETEKISPNVSYSDLEKRVKKRSIRQMRYDGPGEATHLLGKNTLESIFF